MTMVGVIERLVVYEGPIGDYAEGRLMRAPRVSPFVSAGSLETLLDTPSAKLSLCASAVLKKLNDRFLLPMYFASADPSSGKLRSPRRSAPLIFLKADATKVNPKAEYVIQNDFSVKHVGVAHQCTPSHPISSRVRKTPSWPRNWANFSLIWLGIRP
jgi:hypothetical protein